MFSLEQLLMLTAFEFCQDFLLFWLAPSVLGNWPTYVMVRIIKFFFCFWKFLLAFFFINTTHTGYITKQNTGHDSTIQYAVNSIYNDNYSLILLYICYTNNINYSYKCLKFDHFLTNLESLKHLFSCKILYLRLLLYAHILNNVKNNICYKNNNYNVIVLFYRYDFNIWWVYKKLWVKVKLKL